MAPLQSLLLLAGGANLVAADFRAVPDRNAVVPGSYFLRVGNPTIAAKLRAIDPRVKVFPNMMAGSVKLDAKVDPATKALTGSDAAVFIEIVNTATYVEEDIWMASPGSTSLQPVKVADLNAAPGTNTEVPFTTEGSWALQSLANATLSGKGDYKGFGNNGEGVDVYVIANGINVNHPQFEGRASAIFPPNGDASDVTGLGTLEAGIIGSKDFGVANRATILSVKVPYDTTSHGTPATTFYEAGEAIIAHVRKTGRPSVVYTGLVPTNDNTGSAANFFRFLVLSGGIHGSATGASWSDSCSGFGAALSLGADYMVTGAMMPNGKTLNENRGSTVHSPYGSCLSFSAPGFNVKSTSMDGTTAYIHGQNAAAAVTAGLIAGFRSQYPGYDQSEVKAALVSGATNVDTDLSPGGMLFSRNAPKAFDLKAACRSYSPVVSDDFCRAAGCPADYKSMCEINGKGKPSKVCVSIMKNIPTSWCAATGCDPAYSTICTWQCNV